MVSIIIPTFNRGYILRKTLERLKLQTYDHSDFEVIVVDDGSTEDIIAIVESCDLSFDYKVIRMPNRSHNGGKPRNEGAKHAKGDILMFVDSDRLFLQDTLEQHVKIVETDTMIISNGYNLDPKFNVKTLPLIESQIDYTQFFLDYRVEAFEDFVDTAPYFQKEEFPFRFCNTNQVALHRSVFEDIGGFDEGFNKWGFEDNDLGYRLWKKGVRFVFNKKAIAIHHPHLAHTFTNDPYIEMGLYYLKLHPVYEVELSISCYRNQFREWIAQGEKWSEKFQEFAPNDFSSLPFHPDILLGASEMPGQNAGVRISLCEEDEPDMRLLGIRLPYGGKAVENLVISSIWRFLPLRAINKILRESFRVSKNVWIQTLNGTEISKEVEWNGDIEDLLLLGSDTFKYELLEGRSDIYKVIPV